MDLFSPLVALLMCAARPRQWLSSTSTDRFIPKYLIRKLKGPKYVPHEDRAPHRQWRWLLSLRMSFTELFSSSQPKNQMTLI
ncbi:hypothetical protein J6590_028788 [Homalodisca vitripennis]|nr:hypothetical protein J6590_028788 [Homalodisca vitripennis]